MRPLRDSLSGRHLPALDGLRALAAITVVVYHFAPSSTIPAGIGVTCFFVLSGFLITWLLRREWLATGTVSLKAFYTRRALRIFPAYYVFLLLVGLLMLVAHRHWPHGQGWAAAFYYADYYDALVPGSSSSIAHTWSLAVEEHFYLLWPALFLWLAARGRRTMLKGLIAAIIAVVCWRSWLLFGLHVNGAYTYHAFDTRLDSLAIGCCLAVALETERGLAWATATAKRWWFPLITLTILELIAPGASSGPFRGIEPTAEAVCCAVLLVQFMQLSSAPAWSWLDSRAAQTVGRVSYPLYLYHALPELAVRRLPFPAPVQFAIALAGSLALASLSYTLVERPFLRIKSRMGARGERTPALGAPALVQCVTPSEQGVNAAV